SKLDPERALFQVALSCECTNGQLHPYPLPVKAHDREPEEKYLYRDAVPYARGHGVAADWELSGGACRKVWLTFLPVSDVPLATFTLPEDAGEIDPRVLSVNWLSEQCSDPEELTCALEGFVSAYEAWIERERCAAEDAGEEAACALAQRAADWAARMRRGA